eukprot:6490508-Amphidinium_carterae.1
MPGVVENRRALRAAARRRLGLLRDQRVSRTTITRYSNAVAAFNAFALSAFGRAAATLEELDIMMVHYIEALWHNGDSKSLASYTLAGVQHFLMKRQLCPSAWVLMTAWKRAELPQRAPPAPPLL